MLETISGIIASGALSIGYLLTSLFPFLPESLATKPEQCMLIIGFAGQGLLAMRFIIHWLKSEGEAGRLFRSLFGIFLLAAGWCCSYMRSGGRTR